MKWYIIGGFLFGTMTLWLLRSSYASPSGLSAVWLIIWFIFARGLFAFDEHGKSEAIINSLPLKKWEIVAARHLSSLILLIYSFLVMSAWIGILKVIGISYPHAIPWTSVIATGVITCAIGTVILFPILFKVNFVKARWISFFIMFIFIIPLFNSLPKPTAPQPLVLMQTILRIPDSLAVCAATLVFGLLTMISILISTKLYKAREF